MPPKVRNPYAAALPKRVRRGAPLRERLTRPGALPEPIPEPVIAVLATFQGAVNRLVDQLTQLRDSPVLTAGTWVIPPEGVYHFSFDVPARSFQLVNNTAAHTFTVTPGGGGADPARPPDRGAGVHVIPAGKQRIGALISNQITVYGTAGDAFGFSVFSTWITPSA